ncbi:ABC transporter substrate-binding protein [Roseomonas haemaphysalidis]|uniref:ABC transporter substrate-binding protein n=1 Tax=Roseomonas haemaphysalidis TaxID=2768162 RepID=A0ABS3KLG6_9PROT|nr:ABC transporter substrate-binding protein [Roseomonas haemaphysalidis]MBO1078296.1 ABC transporter substrate-binding protein [Roseomonas haemaphysalidis]
MKRRMFLAGLSATALPAPRIAQAQGTRVLRFIPQTDLTVLDPVWTTVYATRDHANMVFDTLYGTDRQYRTSPQMVAGHVVEDDGRLWTLSLRDGLLFHDGTPVLARDCVASIRRWGQRDPFGQALLAATDELSAPDDRTIRFRLKRPFPLLPAALGKLPSTIPAMMPERLARTDAFTQVTEMVGSGPFRFLADERVSGARVAYAKFDRYVPRPDGVSDWTAGPKVVHVDRVEWTTIADPATAAAALQSGEQDWWNYAASDLVPLLRRAAGLKVEALDPSGLFCLMRLNHLQPPFNNPAIRRALFGAINQTDFMTAVATDDPSMFQVPTGFFPHGTPLASDAGMAAIPREPDYDKVRRDLRAAGYKGEKVVFLAATDPAFVKSLADVGADMLQRAGMNVDYQVSDFGTMITRRVTRAPVEQGGWSAFMTALAGIDMLNPAVQAQLRGNGANSWIGWPDSPRIEQLRDEWFQAPTPEAQHAAARAIQLQAFQDVPYLPVGQFSQLTAYSRRLSDVPRGYALFWNVRKSG